MAKGRPKGKVPTKTMVSFRFSEDTMNRMDSMLVNPPLILFDSFRGYPRSRTELIELLIFQAAQQPTAQENPAQPTQPTPV